MGRPIDSQEDWFPTAVDLAESGYLVLTYDRRGVCSPTLESCSGGSDVLSEHWRDVVGAYRNLRRQGAREVVLGGASIGAMATFHASLEKRMDLAGLVWVAGVTNGQYAFDRRTLAELPKVPTLYLSVRNDGYGAAADTRDMHRWTAGPSDLVIVPGRAHGTDLLSDDTPERTRRRVVTSIKDFLNRVP